MYVLSFLFTLHIALSAYVNSTFLSGFMSVSSIGILYTTASVITLLLLSVDSQLLSRFGNKKLTLILLCINLLSLYELISAHSTFLIAVAFIALLSTNTLILLCIDIFIEHFGDKATIGKTRGLYLTITNLAWMVSPAITGTLISKEGGYKVLYLIALVTTSLMTLGLLFSVKRFKDTTYTRTPFFKAYRYLRINRHIRAIVLINFILQLFFAIMVVYIPLYLIHTQGFTWSNLGIVFSAMLAPFVLFGYPIGIAIDKYAFSKRKLLYFGFVILTLSTLCVAYTHAHSILVWSVILFMTRVGASIVETTSEIYFFTHIKEEEAYLLGIFRDMVPLSYIIGPALATIALAYVSIPSIFALLACVTLWGIYYVRQLKTTHES